MDKETLQGVIVKGVGGLYHVMTEDGIAECSTRGKFRQKRYASPLIGDACIIRRADDTLYTIDEILPRRTELRRPNVANVDQLLLTFAAEKPAPDLLLIDKLTVAAETAGVDVIICITKSDLTDASGYAGIYRLAGYPVVVSEHGSGTEELRLLTKDRVTVLAGQSGVGKSTLLNALCGKEHMETGSISEKIGRGKHTTRHVELLPLPYGGYLLDTPGFSAYDLPDKDGLMRGFREFSGVGDCGFSDCTHIGEPGCAVKAALADGKIAQSRYENYKKLFYELKEKKA